MQTVSQNDNVLALDSSAPAASVAPRFMDESNSLNFAEHSDQIRALDGAVVVFLNHFRWNHPTVGILRWTSAEHFKVNVLIQAGMQYSYGVVSSNKEGWDGFRIRKALKTDYPQGALFSNMDRPSID
jgi:single-stranded DNA-specific DHH superfamily exonuclease